MWSYIESKMAELRILFFILHLAGVITYNEFIKLVSESKMKDIVHYLEKVHKTKPNKRTRDSSTAFLDPYEHIDFKPLFENLRDR